MHFPQEVYLWLVTIKAIPNTGEIDEKGLVSLPPTAISSFQNGHAVAEVIRKVAVNNSKPVPSSLSTIKNDASRSTKMTNWNFIWLALEDIDLKMDPRIKELILQGELALIVQLVRQLFQRDDQKGKDSNKASVRIRQAVKAPRQQQVDVKKLNLSKDPQDSQTSLQFLMLLLKASLAISVQQILGLFTNQNKYLAQVIVKGVGQNFQPIILFYTLLIKHSKKLKSFYKQDSKDAEACLVALKPGFISKNQKVVSLTIDLFGKLGDIYAWFVGEGSSSYTFFMGIKRHPQLKKPFWELLMQIIKGEEVPFFTKHYSKSFQSEVEQIQITTLLIELLCGSDLQEKLSGIGVLANWVETAINLKQQDIQAQIIAFRFMGELMLCMPQFIQQSQDAMIVFQRKWYMRTLPEFATLFNEVIVILEKLGSEHNSIASKIYQCITIIAREVGAGDKRDYLVQNFISLIAKFPSIPTEYLIQHLKRVPLSHSEFMLVCQCVEINQSTKTLISVGNFLKLLFLENPLINFYMGAIMKQIVLKVIKDLQEASVFIEKMLQQTLHLHASLEIKYKSKPKHQNISFGMHSSSDKGMKQEQTELAIKQKWKQIVLAFVMNIINVVFNSNEQESLNQLKQSIKAKLLNSNNHIKANRNKVGCKAIEDTLVKRFGISKEEQHALFEEYNKKIAEMSDSMIRSYKPVSHVTIASRLKGPQNLTKQFQQMSEKRRQEQEQRKLQQLKRKAVEEKKRLNVKKQLQITNLLRGQIGEAQLRQQGYLQRLMQEPKELEVISPSQIEQRQLQSIQISFKKYHKVLRHLFLTYTFTMHSAHNNSEKFEDNQQRKEILTVVQLNKLMKDYRLAFLTNQAEISSLVRDINIKLMNKREVNQLDFAGFEQFIIQFCGLIMTRNHTITITSNNNEKTTSSNNYKNQPINVIVGEFFNYLKSVFVARGEKVAIFEEGDMPMSKEQAQEVENYNKKVANRPDYILPKGFKKVSENTIKFNHILSSNISGIPQAYSAAMEIIDEILSQPPFNFHVLESISQKTTVFKVRLSALNAAGLQKERAMSTYIEKPVNDKLYAKRRSSSRGITGLLQSQRSLKDEAAAVLNQIIEKVESGREKEQAKQKRLQSLAKLQQLQKNKQEAAARKQRERQEEKATLLKKEKEAQAKRRQQTQRFLEQQRVKLAEKRRRNEQQQARKAQEQQEKETLKRQNRQKFRSFHQNQVQKIKKIEQTALQKIRKQRLQLQQSKEQREQQRRRLKSQIQQEEKRIIELRKETQRKINSLFQSQPIRKVFSKYQANLRGVYDFIIQNTYVSLTEKKHNNQIIFQSWRQFLNNFEFTAFVLPKDTTLIFKNLTKAKLVSKDYHVGLTFSEFQQALLRLCIKYRAIFNLVAERIKDINKAEVKGESKEEMKKDENEFETVDQTTIKDLLKQGLASKDNIEQYGQISQVTEKTLLGLIYYLKVPRSKQGQEKRFREVLQRKHPGFVHQTQWLKQKLNEQYSLQQPQKKGNNSRVIAQNGSISQVSIK